MVIKQNPVVKDATLDCEIVQSAFSGEVVFVVTTQNAETYKGVAPKHDVHFSELSTKPSDGMLNVRVLRNGGASAIVAAPDGQILEVSSQLVHYLERSA